MICGIYKIECMVNGKVYIGQSQDIERRWGRHKRELENGEHNNNHLQAAFNKYRADNFTWEIIEECEESLLDDKEIFYIEKYDSYNREKGYNQTIGGGGTRGFNREFSEEHRRKIGEAKKGEKNPMYGRTGEKNPMYGKGKKVICLETGIIYSTIREAGRELNLHYQSIYKVCRGKRKTTGGYHFKYVD